MLALNSEKHTEIATIEKFQIDLTYNDQVPRYRQLNADMVPLNLLYFESGSTWLEPGKKVYMASFLSSNGHISVHYDNIHLQLSTHASFETRFHFMLQKYENSKNRFL